MKKLLALTLILGAQLAQAAPPDAREINRKIGRGINLGNALEAPKEGEWGLTLEEGYFEAI